MLVGISSSMILIELYSGVCSRLILTWEVWCLKTPLKTSKWYRLLKYIVCNIWNFLSKKTIKLLLYLWKFLEESLAIMMNNYQYFHNIMIRFKAHLKNITKVIMHCLQGMTACIDMSDTNIMYHVGVILRRTIRYRKNPFRC